MRRLPRLAPGLAVAIALLFTSATAKGAGGAFEAGRTLLEVLTAPRLAFGVGPVVSGGNGLAAGPGARLELSGYAYFVSLAAGPRFAYHPSHTLVGEGRAVATGGLSTALGGDLTFFGILGIGATYHLLPVVENRASLDVLAQVPVPVGLALPAYRSSRVYLVPYYRACFLVGDDRRIDEGGLLLKVSTVSMP